MSTPKLFAPPQRDATLKEKVFGLDYRSLAIFRIILAIIIIGDVLDRCHDLRAHYSDEAQLYPHDFWLNPYMLVGFPAGVAILFFLHILIALSLCVGYQTRVCVILAWIFQAGLEARNTIIQHGGSVYFRCVLFWSIWLPLGRVWSVDSLDESNSKQLEKVYTKTYCLGLATVGYITQVVNLYIYAYYLKADPTWTKDHTAVELALRVEYFQTPLARIFLRFPELTKFLTQAVLIWEGWGPFLYFAPVYHDQLRMLGVAGNLALHVGFGSCMRLGTFFWMTCVAQLPLIPAWFWDVIIPRIRRSRFVDHLCLAITTAWQNALMHLHTGVRTLRTLGLLRELIHTLPPVSRPTLRYWRFFVTVFLVVALTVSLAQNASSLYEVADGENATPSWRDDTTLFAEQIGVDQQWGMFAPPPVEDYWIVLEATNLANFTFDLFRDRGYLDMETRTHVWWDPPPVEDFHLAFYNHRWSIMWDALVSDEYPELRPAFGHYLCHTWGLYHPGPNSLREFKIWAVGHRHLLGKAPDAREPTETKLVLHYHCVPPEPVPQRPARVRSGHHPAGYQYH